MSGSSDAGEILDENRESQDAGSQDGMSAATEHGTDISYLVRALNLDGAPKTSETVKSKSTIEKSTTEEEWKWYEQCIIERKLQDQFDKSLGLYYERNTILGRHLMPPMYFYTKNGTLEKYNHIPGPPRTQPCQVWKQQCGEIVIPTQIFDSKHFQRIQTIKVTTGLTPESEGCLYYVILRLPGVDNEHNDQGYIGITTTSLKTRWSNHNTASVVDKNLRLIQEHCKCAEDQTTYYKTLSDYAAILVLRRTTNEKELKVWEAHYMRQTYCTTHDREATRECLERQSECRATHIKLGEKQYGMNDPTKVKKP